MLQIYNEKVQDLLADAKQVRGVMTRTVIFFLLIPRVSGREINALASLNTRWQEKDSLDIKRGPRGNYVEGLLALFIA